MVAAVVGCGANTTTESARRPVRQAVARTEDPCAPGSSFRKESARRAAEASQAYAQDARRHGLVAGATNFGCASITVPAHHTP
jgi:hypothetical protein